jgi:hypothetical protein
MKMSELIDDKKYTEVSFMIFRTGSCLIVGNCNERVLMVVYRFIRNILNQEYSAIYVPNENNDSKVKNTKIRKKNIQVSNDYYNRFICV